MPGKNQKVEWTRYVYSNVMQEIHLQQKDLKDIQKSLKFLRGEALFHQYLLSDDDVDANLFGPEAEKFNLSDELINVIEKRKASQELLSVSGVSNLQLGMERVDEDIDESRKDSTTPAAVVVKSFTVEGKVDDVAYATNFLASYNRNNEAEVDEVTDLKCSSKRDIIKQAIQSDQPITPMSLHSITSELYFLQILESEREETLSQLEAEIPDFEVVKGLEPIVITFIPTRGHEISIHWTIIRDARNERYKYEIAVNCTDEVAARFRKVKQIHPYLTGQSQLGTCQDVTDFVEAFGL